MIINSTINPRSEEFEANRQHMQTLVDDLREKIAQISQGGGEKYQKRHTERGLSLIHISEPTRPY